MKRVTKKYVENEFSKGLNPDEVKIKLFQEKKNVSIVNKVLKESVKKSHLTGRKRPVYHFKNQTVSSKKTFSFYIFLDSINPFFESHYSKKNMTKSLRFSADMLYFFGIILVFESVIFSILLSETFDIINIGAVTFSSSSPIIAMFVPLFIMFFAILNLLSAYYISRITQAGRILGILSSLFGILPLQTFFIALPFAFILTGLLPSGIAPWEFYIYIPAFLILLIFFFIGATLFKEKDRFSLLTVTKEQKALKFKVRNKLKKTRRHQKEISKYINGNSRSKIKKKENKNKKKRL